MFYTLFHTCIEDENLWLFRTLELANLARARIIQQRIHEYSSTLSEDTSLEDLINSQEYAEACEDWNSFTNYDEALDIRPIEPINCERQLSRHIGAVP
jgi:hypothetical protein